MLVSVLLWVARASFAGQIDTGCRRAQVASVSLLWECEQTSEEAPSGVGPLGPIDVVEAARNSDKSPLEWPDSAHINSPCGRFLAPGAPTSGHLPSALNWTIERVDTLFRVAQIWQNSPPSCMKIAAIRLRARKSHWRRNSKEIFERWRRPKRARKLSGNWAECWPATKWAA